MPKSDEWRAEEAAGVAVVVPIRSFAGGKSRLATLGPEQRSAIGRLAAHAVLEASIDYHAHVVTGDGQVASWARGLGASVLVRREGSLNADLESALSELEAKGYRRVVIALGDLPLLKAADICAAAASRGFYLIPDRHRTGTNLLSCDLPCAIRLAFGKESFPAHLAAIAEAGAECLIDELSLARYDIDVSQDLDVLATLASRESLTPREVNRLVSILSLAVRSTA